jgi:2-polyprenyl-3-methyl-5-hydroxy-6-metoxy-1,4-benzoquinol methylase
MAFQDAQATWDARFAKADYHFGREPAVFLAAQQSRIAGYLAARPGATALAVSDGEGRNSVWLARQGLKVTAFDISPVGVEKARKLAADAGVPVDYHVEDINAFDWDAAQYDLVVVIFIQYASPPERARIFAGIQRALKPGGLAIIQGYGLRQLEYKTGGPGKAENLYTMDMMRESFAALEPQLLAEHDAIVNEGPGHNGMSALVDFVGRRPAATT